MQCGNACGRPYPLSTLLADASGGVCATGHKIFLIAFQSALPTSEKLAFAFREQLFGFLLGSFGFGTQSRCRLGSFTRQTRRAACAMACALKCCGCGEAFLHFEFFVAVTWLLIHSVCSVKQMKGVRLKRKTFALMNQNQAPTSPLRLKSGELSIKLANFMIRGKSSPRL